MTIREGFDFPPQRRMSPRIEIRLLSAADSPVFDRVAPDVFDDEVDAELVREFLADRRHHIMVALDEEVVVGFASALDFIHPDKKAQLWLNELSVARTHRRSGIGRALVTAMLNYGREMGCSEVWLATEKENKPAMALYESLGMAQEPRNPVLFTFDLKC